MYWRSNRRRIVPVLPEAQQVASPQGWYEAYRRPHARRAHRDDSRIQATGERTYGQPRDDISEMKNLNDHGNSSPQY